MSDMYSSFKQIVLRWPLAAAILLLFAFLPSARAQTLTTLYSFTGSPHDGAFPVADLLLDAQGNLYGTTGAGGAGGAGTVFKLTPSGAETLLHSFSFPLTIVPSRRREGFYPWAGLVSDAAGNLYGTTYYGGTPSPACERGCGTVFQVTPAGSEKVLHVFTGSPNDGQYPYADLVMDAQGNLYGTTDSGGANRQGTVFKLTPSGTETVLHSFSGLEGLGPYKAGVILDEQGNLYGTNSSGGAGGYGTVFELTANGTLTVLYSFTGAGDGGLPFGGLVRDAQGNLYGTTWQDGAYGWGTVFKVTANGTETVLHSFASGQDGALPYAGLIRDAQGNLYGTTLNGGIYGNGTVFKLTANGTETVLHSFGDNLMDWGSPFAGVIMDAQGNLYGSTIYGGTYHAGTVFELTP